MIVRSNCRQCASRTLAEFAVPDVIATSNNLIIWASSQIAIQKIMILEFFSWFRTHRQYLLSAFTVVSRAKLVTGSRCNSLPLEWEISTLYNFAWSDWVTHRLIHSLTATNSEHNVLWVLPCYPIFRFLYSLMLTDLGSPPSHNVWNGWITQAGMEAAGICCTWCYSELSCSWAQIWKSISYRGRGQKGESVGSGKTQLYHESFRT